MLDDICGSLIKNGISRILIINGHYGNLDSLKDFERKKKKSRKIKVISYWKYMDREFDHAGNVETSIMLAISKNVKMNNAKKGFQTDGMSKQEISKIPGENMKNQSQKSIQQEQLFINKKSESH